MWYKTEKVSKVLENINSSLIPLPTTQFLFPKPVSITGISDIFPELFSVHLEICYVFVYFLHESGG